MSRLIQVGTSPLARLGPNDRIPPHPERPGLYHVLDGTGFVTVDDEPYPLTAGVTVIAPEGSARDFEAGTRHAFIAARVEQEPSSTPSSPTGGFTMEITKDTKVSAILREYGDIAEVMEAFGVKRVARYSFRSFIARALTVERAARIHGVPLDDFLATLRAAVDSQGKPSPEPIEPTDPASNA